MSTHNVKILAQYIKDLSFELPGAPEIFSNQQGRPDINVSIDIDAKKISENNFEIGLKIKAESKIADQPFFICELLYCGVFSFGKIDENLLEQILLIYCPNLLFPFVRRIITNLTSDAGLAPLMLDPIDFAELYNRRKKVANAAPVSNLKN
jgi:preprotein translocase subunit SecB